MTRGEPLCERAVGILGGGDEIVFAGTNPFNGFHVITEPRADAKFLQSN
jgi:hypothetical protein